MEKRKQINLNLNTMELAILMSEGNPGAISVIMEIIKKENLMDLLHLDDMNIRGTQIWVGFKDYCGQDIEKFTECVRARDKDMVALINEEGSLGNHSEVAVTSGASYR